MNDGSEAAAAPRSRSTNGADGDGEHELALKLWVVLSRAHQAVAEHVRADIERHGLTVGEFGVLEALYHKGPLHLGRVREKILVSSGGITYLMDRLEEKGLAERRPCPEDRRASFAALTDEGEEMIRRIFPEHAAVLGRALSGLPAERKADAVRLLKELGHGAAAKPLPGAAGADG